MSGRMAPAWFRWVELRLREQYDTLENIERTLATFKTQQKRMLYGLLLIIGVYLIDILLRFN